jgi:hypothetical protein
MESRNKARYLPGCFICPSKYNSSTNIKVFSLKTGIAIDWTGFGIILPTLLFCSKMVEQVQIVSLSTSSAKHKQLAALEPGGVEGSLLPGFPDITKCTG